MHHPTDRITHTTAFVTPVVEHWLEREIAQWVHPMKDRYDDPSHDERTLLPRSYILLLAGTRQYMNESQMRMTDAGTTQDNFILPAPPVGGLPICQDWLGVDGYTSSVLTTPRVYQQTMASVHSLLITIGFLPQNGVGKSITETGRYECGLSPQNGDS